MHNCYVLLMTRKMTATEMRSLGGKVRAANMTVRQRKAAARKAAKARWSKHNAG